MENFKTNKPPDKKDENKVSRRDFLKLFGSAAAYSIVSKDLIGKDFDLKIEDLFNSVKAETISELRGNKEILEQIGEKNLEALIKTIENLDLSRIKSRISEIAGIPIQEREIKSLHIVTNSEIKEKGEDLNTAGSTDGESINIVLNSCINQNDFEEAIFYRIFVHEYSHILTMNLDQKDKKTPWTDEFSLPLDIYEGVTELESIKICDSLNYKPKNFYGYHGGNLLTAHFMDQIADGELSRNFFGMQIKSLQEKLEDKLGKDCWKELFASRGIQIEEFIIGGLNDLQLMLKLLIYCEQKGVNWQEILSKAEQLGIDEKVEMIFGQPGEQKEIVGIVDSKIYGDKLGVKGVIKDSDRMHNLLPIFSFFMSANRGMPYSEEDNSKVIDLFERYLTFLENLINNLNEYEKKGMDKETLSRLAQVEGNSICNFYIQSEKLSQDLKNFEQVAEDVDREKLREEIIFNLKNEMQKILALFNEARKKREK